MRTAGPTLKSIRQTLGSRAVVWVDPGKITHHTGTKWPVTKLRLARARRVLPRALTNPLRPLLKSREPFFIPREVFATPTSVEDEHRYGLLSDFIARRDTPEDTEWFRLLLRECRSGGIAHHKSIEMRSETDILDFLRGYAGGLIDSLVRDGFRPEKTGYESTAVITADGALTKAGSGNHRFAICRILGIERFPLRIVGAHEDWYRSNAPGARFDTETLLALFQRVEAAHR